MAKPVTVPPRSETGAADSRDPQGSQVARNTAKAKPRMTAVKSAPTAPPSNVKQEYEEVNLLADREACRDESLKKELAEISYESEPRLQPDWAQSYFYDGVEEEFRTYYQIGFTGA